MAERSCTCFVRDFFIALPVSTDQQEHCQQGGGEQKAGKIRSRKGEGGREDSSYPKSCTIRGLLFFLCHYLIGVLLWLTAYLDSPRLGATPLEAARCAPSFSPGFSSAFREVASKQIWKEKSCTITSTDKSPLTVSVITLNSSHSWILRWNGVGGGHPSELRGLRQTGTAQAYQSVLRLRRTKLSALMSVCFQQRFLAFSRKIRNVACYAFAQLDGDDTGCFSLDHAWTHTHESESESFLCWSSLSSVNPDMMNNHVIAICGGNLCHSAPELVSVRSPSRHITPCILSAAKTLLLTLSLSDREWKWDWEVDSQWSPHGSGASGRL